MKIGPGQILVEHEFRRDRKTGQPVVQGMSILAFEKAPSVQHPETGELYPNAGWKRIKKEALVEPKAAKEAKAKKESSADKIKNLAANVEPEEVK